MAFKNRKSAESTGIYGNRCGQGCEAGVGYFRGVLVDWSTCWTIYPESGGWCGAQTCQAASWLHVTWRSHRLRWEGWTVGYPLPGGVASSGFRIVGTGDRVLLVTVSWAIVVGSPVRCQVVFAGSQGPESGWDAPGCGCVGFPVAARGSIWVGVIGCWIVGWGSNWVAMYRIVGQVSGCGPGSNRVGMYRAVSRRFSNHGPGVESGQYVPGHGCVGFPVMAGGRVGSVFARSRSRRVSGCGPGGRIGSGRYVPDCGSGFRLQAGVESGWYVPGHDHVGFPIVAGGQVGSVFLGQGRVRFQAGADCRLQVAGCKCIVVNDNGITMVTGGSVLGSCQGASGLGLGLRLRLRLRSRLRWQLRYRLLGWARWVGDWYRPFGVALRL